MAIGEMTLTAVGNLTADPELRYTPTGQPVAAFTVAVNPRQFDKQSGRWVEADPSFVACQAWRDLAEHVAESLTRGDRVIVTGRWREERWEKDGEKRSRWVLTADAVGVELTWATARPQRTRRASGADVPPGDSWATGSSTPPAPAQDGVPF